MPSELSVSNAVEKAQIKFGKDSSLKIYPKNAGTTLDQAEPFFYQRGVEIESVGNKFYNDSEKIIQFNITFPRPLNDDITEAKKQILEIYEKDGSSVARVVLNPLEIASYEVWLKVLDREFLLESGERKQGPYGSSDLRIRIKLEDFDEDGVIHRYLTNNPEFITIIFRPYYLFTLTDTSSVSGTLSMEAVNRAFEKIFGEGSARSEYLVDREVSQALKEELVESVEIVFDRIDPNGSYTDLAVDYVMDFMSNLKPLELSELEAARENLFIYGIGEAKKEITPDEFRKLTTSYKESNKVMESLKKEWNNLVDFASNSRSVEKFHKESRSHLEKSFDTYIKGKVQVAFVKVKPNAGTKWHLEKSTENLTDSEKEEVREVQQTISNSGSYEEELFNEAYKEWTGEDYQEGVNVKHLNIHKVSRVDISKGLTVKVTINEAVGEEARRGPEIQFGISDEDLNDKKEPPEEDKKKEPEKSNSGGSTQIGRIDPDSIRRIQKITRLPLIDEIKFRKTKNRLLERKLRRFPSNKLAPLTSDGLIRVRFGTVRPKIKSD